MNFLNTFSEISRNQNNFKNWEQDEADIKAKREQYFAQNPPSESDLTQAKKFGRVVVDSVDFMDALSEDKAESVEMAAEQTIGYATVLGTYGALFLSYLPLKKRASDFEKHQKNIKNSVAKLNHREHREIINDLISNKMIREIKHGNDVSILELNENTFSGTKILDKNKFNELEETTQKYLKDVITEDGFKLYKQFKNSVNKQFAILMAVPMSIFIIGQMIIVPLQVKASRIARYQARESLKNPKNFVEYTDSQREEAKKYKQRINSDNDKIQGNLKDIRSLLKDKTDYEKESEKLSNIHLSDIAETNPSDAYKKQVIINESIKKINNTAEEYSENMETAAGFVAGSSLLGGAVIGKAADFIFKKVDEIKYKKTLGNPLKATEKSIKNISRKAYFFSFMWNNIIKAHPSISGAFLGMIIVSPFVTKLQKESARAGRYKAKRELEENPQNFVYVEKSDLDKQTATGKVQKDSLADIIKFIPKSAKIIKEYEKYKKTELPERKAEMEALKSVQVSDKQLKDAENLQTRLYKSFDTIDDHSQEYSEKMEAVCEIAKNILENAVSLIPVAMFAFVAKYPQKIIKPLTSVVSGVFKRFSQFTKKYTENLGQNAINKMTEKITKHFEYKDLAFAEKDIDEALQTVDENVFTAKMQDLRTKFIQKFENEYRADGYLEKIKNFRKDKKIKDSIKDLVPDGLNSDKIQNYFGEITKSLQSTKDNPEKIRVLFNELIQFNNVPDINLKKLSDKNIIKIKENILSLIESLPKEELSKSLSKYSEFSLQTNTKTMIMTNHHLSLTPKQIFLNKDIVKKFWGIIGLYFAGQMGINYSIQTYFAAKTKQAGRLGTMKAIQELDKENENALKGGFVQNQKTTA